jgi:BirA family biotin operon repressor/biotin-[acetyl-CoA-carboxylase] ligase
LLRDRKLAGILAQRVPGRDAVIIGMGLNVGWAPDGAAALASVVADRAVAPAAVLVALLDELDALGDDVAARYRAELVTVGRSVRVELPSGAALLGRAMDVDDMGRLVVLDAAGVRHELDVGDVVHVRDLEP